MEGIGDTIQTLEALGQDPCLQWCQLVGRQEESGTGQQTPFRVNTSGECMGVRILWGISNMSLYKSKPKSSLSSQPACNVRPFYCR